MKSPKKLALLTVFLSCFGGSAYAATLNGNVVQGINVAGQYWDATLVAQPTSITTYNTTFAQAANNALLNELNSGSLHGTAFDTTGLYAGDNEAYMTFYDTSNASKSDYEVLWNNQGSIADYLQYHFNYPENPAWFTSYISSQPDVYSVEWNPSVSVSTVPLPPAAFMFAPALLGLMGLRRKPNLAA